MKNTLATLRAEAHTLVATYTPTTDFDTLVAKLATLGRRMIETRLGLA